MILKIVALPFKLIGFIFKLFGKCGKWTMHNFFGALAVATIGFLLGMKYLETNEKKSGDNADGGA